MKIVKNSGVPEAPGLLRSGLQVCAHSAPKVGRIQGEVEFTGASFNQTWKTSVLAAVLVIVQPSHLGFHIQKEKGKLELALQSPSARWRSCMESPVALILFVEWGFTEPSAVAPDAIGTFEIKGAGRVSSSFWHPALPRSVL